jgi:ribokinase
VHTSLQILGANELLSEADVAAAKAMIGGAKVVVCQHEVPIETTIAALRIADAAGVTSIFNPAPAQPPLPTEAFTLPSVFCVNETEAQLFTGIEVTDAASAEAAGTKLMAMGCKTVLLTLGENGVMFLQPGQPTLSVPAVKVKAIDTSGAGDSYIGALAFYLSKGSLGWEEALRRANTIAAESVQAHGTQSSYKSKAELPKELFLFPKL